MDGGSKNSDSNLWSRSNVGANLVFAREQKPVSNLWSRIYINRSPSGIGSIPVFVRGRTQGSPLHSFSDIGSKNIQELLGVESKIKKRGSYYLCLDLSPEKLLTRLGGKTHRNEYDVLVLSKNSHSSSWVN